MIYEYIQLYTHITLTMDPVLRVILGISCHDATKIIMKFPAYYPLWPMIEQTKTEGFKIATS